MEGKSFQAPSLSFIKNRKVPGHPNSFIGAGTLNL